MAEGGIDTRTARISAEEALALHASGRPGKLETRITKALTTARDLSLAYSPGVAEPCLHIARDPALATGSRQTRLAISSTTGWFGS